MDHNDSIVAIFAIFCVFGAPVAAFIVMRILAHRERIEMIRRGMAPPTGMFGGGRRAWRTWQAQQQAQQGRPWQQGGPIPGAPPAAGYGDDDDPQCALFKGIRLAMIGLAIFIGLSFIGGMPGSPDFRGGPWLLGGLIPMFVGIAQMIIALLSGAQFPVGPRATFIPPPSPPPPPPPGASTPPPSAWQQPGRRFEELSKPVQPPDIQH